MKNYDVVALGELLVDFTQNGISAQGNWLMEANAGGAPCNVLAMLAKLGHSVSFVGKVGDDMFGKMLQSKITSLGIGIENLVFSQKYKTTLAFVHTANDGDRSFSFYRNHGADSMLEKSELKPELISDAKIFHFGTLSMTNEICFDATKFALETAKKSGVLRSFDPNLRLPLWEDENQAKEKILFGLSECEILKIAAEELEFVSGKKSIFDGENWLRSKFNIPLITVTKGKNGSEAFYSDGKISLYETAGTFSNVKTIDTTGAGDTFCACILHEILCNGYESFSVERLQKMLVFANAASSLVTTKKGSLSVMPARSEIKQLIKDFSMR